MELWYTENHTEHVRFSIKVKAHLYSNQSDYQRIDVFDSIEFGRILTLDDVIMLTEKDEFIYHEMITHVPMAVNSAIKNVLVIGAGDGGTVSQLVRYQTIETIDVIEIDREVIAVSRKYFPGLANHFDDPRVHIFYEDGLKYVRFIQSAYDLIIVDSTDPFGPGEGLFTKEFYGNCYKALNDEGILVNQHESPYYDNDAKAMIRTHDRLKIYFPICSVYQAHIPTYPSGHWLFGFAAKNHQPVKDVSRWNDLGIKTHYYNTDLHNGSFYIPNYVKVLLGENG